MSSVTSTAFYLVLNMSITATAIGILIVLFRFVKQIPRFIIYALWGLVFIRLVFPFAFSSEASILNLAGSFIKKVVEVPVPVQDNSYLSFTNCIGTARSYFPVTYKSDYLKMVFEGTSFIWLIGALAAILTVIILYYLSSSELSKAVHLKDNIYVSDMVQSPMVFGVFRQRIIIPSHLEEDSQQLKYVLLHELVHVKRHDNLLRILAVFTACIHWFNPFVWIFLRMFFGDMELSCDLAAVKQLSKKDKNQYAQVLVNMGTGQKVFMSTAFAKTNVKVRVLNVLGYKRLTALATVFSVLFVIAVAIALLTNPVK